ncbi:MAG TPA: hypothetical protein VJ248_05460 [Candidatus Udaeobacter sp.]|nr:hypothetical protein [Candidatus Udaeobacter sp.]
MAALSSVGLIDAVNGGNSVANGLLGAFSASAAGVTGAAIGTTSAPALYNPAGSGKVCKITSIRFGDVSGTIIRANIRYYWAINQVPTGVTLGTIRSHSKGVPSVAQFLTALTVGTAASVFLASGLGSGGAVAAQFYSLIDRVEGDLTVLPGEIFYPYVSNGALAMVADVSMTWIEYAPPTGNI